MSYQLTMLAFEDGAPLRLHSTDVNVGIHCRAVVVNAPCSVQVVREKDVTSGNEPAA
jgi:hypothetical protein